MNFGRLFRFPSFFTEPLRLYDHDEDDSVGGGEVSDGEVGDDLDSDIPPVVDETGNELGLEPDGISKEIADYRGSEKVNPSQRPVKGIDRRGKTKEDIDDLLALSDGDFFMTDEEIAAAAKEKEESVKKDVESDEPEGGSGEKSEKKKPEGDEDDDNEDGEDETLKNFMESYGLEESDLQDVPDGLKEKLVESYLEKGKEPTPLPTESEEYRELDTALKTLQKDPLIAARINEIERGATDKVARNLAPVTDAELKAFDKYVESKNFAKARGFINEMIRNRAAAAIQIERAVADKNAVVTKLDMKLNDVFGEVAKLDDRLAIEEKDIMNISPSHKEYSKFKSGIGDVLEFAMDLGLSKTAITKMGHETLYKIYAARKGWDKERDKKIADASKKELLKKIKGTKPGRTIKPKPGSSARSANGQAVGTRDSLIKQIAAGDKTAYNKLLDKAEDSGDQRRVAALGDILRRGLALRDAENKNKVT